MEETMTPSDLTRLDMQLDRLHLSHVKGHYQDLATQAARKQLSHLAYLAELIEGEAAVRENRAIERRIKKARFPVLKTIEDFQWSWPKKINRPADPEPVPFGLYRSQHQRRLHQQCRPRQDAHRHCARPRRLHRWAPREIDHADINADCRSD